mgnify:CR=1 FL=1
MKVTKRQLQRIIAEERSRLTEANADGTISPGEDAEVRIFLADIEEQIEDLVRFVQMEADRIGGGFRGPGLKKRAFKILADIVHEYR